MHPASSAACVLAELQPARPAHAHTSRTWLMCNLQDFAYPFIVRPLLSNRERGSVRPREADRASLTLRSEISRPLTSCVARSGWEPARVLAPQASELASFRPATPSSPRFAVRYPFDAAQADTCPPCLAEVNNYQTHPQRCARAARAGETSRLGGSTEVPSRAATLPRWYGAAPSGSAAGCRSATGSMSGFATTTPPGNVETRFERNVWPRAPRPRRGNNRPPCCPVADRAMPLAITARTQLGKRDVPRLWAIALEDPSGRVAGRSPGLPSALKRTVAPL
jgi:hypothetical protein